MAAGRASGDVVHGRKQWVWLLQSDGDVLGDYSHQVLKVEMKKSTGKEAGECGADEAGEELRSVHG